MLPLLHAGLCSNRQGQSQHGQNDEQQEGQILQHQTGDRHIAISIGVGNAVFVLAHQIAGAIIGSGQCICLGGSVVSNGLNTIFNDAHTGSVAICGGNFGDDIAGTNGQIIKDKALAIVQVEGGFLTDSAFNGLFADLTGIRGNAVTLGAGLDKGDGERKVLGLIGQIALSVLVWQRSLSSRSPSTL